MTRRTSSRVPTCERLVAEHDVAGLARIDPEAGVELFSHRRRCIAAGNEQHVGCKILIQLKRGDVSFGVYKAEVIHRRGPWRSFEAVEFATLEWVDWFNHRRLLEPIGNIPPAEAEANYYAATAAMDNIPMAA